MITVPKLLRLYRRLLDSRIPLIERIGERVRVRVYADHVERAKPYVINGITLWLDWMDATDAYYIFRRTWEPENTRFILKTLEADDTFVDIGANVGYFSFLAAPHAKKVLAIEPLARNIYAIERGIESNKAANVTLEPVAVGDSNKVISLGYRLMASGSPSALDFFGNAKAVIPAYILHDQVPQFSLRVVFERNNISQCKILKMDIQGAEYAALKSIEYMLKKKAIDHILIEHNGSVYGNKVHDLLTSYGYVCRNAREELVIGELEDKRDYIYSVS